MSDAVFPIIATFVVIALVVSWALAIASGDRTKRRRRSVWGAADSSTNAFGESTGHSSGHHGSHDGGGGGHGGHSGCSGGSSGCSGGSSCGGGGCGGGGCGGG